MSKINSVIIIDPKTNKMNTSNICKLVCWKKYDIQEKIQEVLENPHYSIADDEERFLLFDNCEKNPSDQCVFEIIRDDKC